MLEHVLNLNIKITTSTDQDYKETENRNKRKGRADSPNNERTKKTREDLACTVEDQEPVEIIEGNDGILGDESEAAS